MKWPRRLKLIRHGNSIFNQSKETKSKDPEYQVFDSLFKEEWKALDLSNFSFNSPRWASGKLMDMAYRMWIKYRLCVSDYNTPLTDLGVRQAEETGSGLEKNSHGNPPSVIYISPYLRTRQTLIGLQKGFPALKKAKVFVDDNLAEQKHGLANLYNDWKIFAVLEPKQGLLLKMEGNYDYCFPNGEDKPMVKARGKNILDTVIRNNPGDYVYFVTHHLAILSIMAIHGRWDKEKFIQVDKDYKPINCGVTVYKGNPTKGSNGRLELEYYNRKFYI